jgi:hypothetical protein
MSSRLKAVVHAYFVGFLLPLPLEQFLAQRGLRCRPTSL